MWVPAIEQPRKRLSFRRLELHVIAVKVEPLRVLTHAHPAERTVLRGSILYVDLLVAVRVVDRRDQDNQFVEQRAHVAKHNAPGHVLHRLLAFDFAGVNVREDEDYRFTRSSRIARLRNWRITEDDKRKRSTFHGM